jgi:outer membrane lipoprotein SlyB
MIRTLAATSLLALACVAPLQQAAAQDAIGGAIFGGAAGALLGGAIGGRGGAVAGAIIGGTTGAAIAAEGQRRRDGYYWYRNGCYVQRPDGAYVAVSPQYCAAPVAPAAVAMPPDEDDEVEMVAPPQRAVNADAVAACARRYRSYDPRSGTFLSNDGMRKPCP